MHEVPVSSALHGLRRVERDPHADRDLPLSGGDAPGGAPAATGGRAFAGEGEPFGGVKGEIERLLGYARRDDPAADPLLATSNAYDAAYEVLYDLLPACRGGCGCTGPV